MRASGTGVPDEVREHLERIVIELVGIASRPELDPALLEELMGLAQDISSVLEE